MLCLKDCEHKISQFDLFGQRPGDCHISGNNQETEIEDDGGDKVIPFLCAEAALVPIIGRKTEE